MKTRWLTAAEIESLRAELRAMRPPLSDPPKNLGETMIEQKHLIPLEQFAASTGWELMVEWLEQSIETDLANLLRSDEPYKAAKFAGAVAAFRTIKNWPMAAIQSLKQPHEE